MKILQYDEFNRIFYFDRFESEVKSLFGKSNAEYKQYVKYLFGQLQKLDNTNFHLCEPPFEHLSEKRADLYRIKSKSKKKNVRVIYCYRSRDKSKNERIILLTAFEEKSSSDYDRGINLALERINRIID